MKRTYADRPHRKEPYHYDAARGEYLAGIKRALLNDKVPLRALQIVFHILLPYMHSD